MERKRFADKDIMRVIAAVAVVFLHAASPEKGLTLAVMNTLTRFCVPLFFMISGSLMLSRDYGVKRILAKCARTLCVVFVWSGVYALLEFAVNHKSFTVSELLQYLVLQPVHLWYLWAAIGLYLLTPILRVFCKNADRATLGYALALLFILGCAVYPLTAWGGLPVLSDFIARTHLPLDVGFVFCYVFGCFADRLENVKKPLCAAALAVCLAATYLLTGVSPDAAMSFASPFNVGAAACIYLILKGCDCRPASHLAPLTLGVYLIHPAILVYVLRPNAAAVSPGGLRVLCAGLAALAASAVITLLLRLIPPVRRRLL